MDAADIFRGMLIFMRLSKLISVTFRVARYTREREGEDEKAFLSFSSLFSLGAIFFVKDKSGEIAGRG